MGETSTKKTKKKKAAKKRKSAGKAKSENKKLIKNAPAEHYFILANGQPLKNVKELAETLEHLSEEVFNHHVTHDRNDFANWIKDIFRDVELAEELAGIKDKHHARIVLYKHIVRKI